MRCRQGMESGVLLDDEMLSVASDVEVGTGVESATGTQSGDSVHDLQVTDETGPLEVDLWIGVQIHQLHNIQICVACPAAKVRFSTM